MTIDEILAKLEDPSIEPGFEDWRNCLVFWARPTERVRSLIAQVQKKLQDVVPNLWIMPQMSLHMTALEITHSLTAEEIDALVQQMQSHIAKVADYTLDHRARLVKPMVSYDAQALALSFLPASSEPGGSGHDGRYTYHHLRRDLYTQVSATGVKVASRYVIPSAHLTIGRFIRKSDFEKQDGSVDHGEVERLVATIEEINDWLQREYWPSESGIKEGGEWIVGEEKGLTCRKGTLWYGEGGETLYQGKGFKESRVDGSVGAE